MDGSPLPDGAGYVCGWRWSGFRSGIDARRFCCRPCMADLRRSIFMVGQDPPYKTARADSAAAVMDTARVARNPSPALPHGGGGCGGCFAHLFLSRPVWCAGAYPTNCEGGQCGRLQASAAVRDSARVARNPSPALPHGGGDISAAWAQPRMVTAFMISSTPKRWPSCDWMWMAFM